MAGSEPTREPVSGDGAPFFVRHRYVVVALVAIAIGLYGPDVVDHKPVRPPGPVEQHGHGLDLRQIERMAAAPVPHAEGHGQCS